MSDKPNGHDYLRWARVVGSTLAAWHLIEGARTDPRLADILAAHKADGFARVQDYGARKALEAATREAA